MVLLLRVLGMIGATLALVVVFCAAVVGGIFLHLDTPPGRHVVQRLGEALLASALPGDIHLTGVEELGLRSLRVDQVRVRDPEGFVVIDARDLEADLTLMSTLAALFGGRGTEVRLPFVRVAEARISLATTPDGKLRIARAFAEEAPEPSPPTRRPVVVLDRVELPRVEVVDVPVVSEALLVGVTGSLATAEDLVIQVDDASIVSHPPDLPALALGVALHFRVRDGRLAGGATLDGIVGGLPLSVDARLFEDQRVGARLAAGPAGGALLGRWLPPLADLEGVLAAGLSLEGTLQAATLSGDVVHFRGPQDVGRLELRADLATEPVATALARVRFRDLDLAAVVPTLPRTRLRGQTTARATSLEDPRAVLRLHLEPSQVEGRATPRAEVDLRFREGALTGAVRLRERGELDAEVSLVDRRLALRADLAALELAALPGGLEGVVSGTAQAELSLDPFRIVKARTDLRAAGVRVQAVGAQRLRLRGTASGAVENLSVDATVAASDVTAAGEQLGWLRAEVKGRGGTLALKARGGGGAEIERLAVRSELDLSPQRLRGTEISARVRGLELSASAPRIGFERGLEIPAARIRGLGEDMEASFRRDDAGLDATVFAPRIDLSRVERLIGGALKLRGTAAVRARLEQRRQGYGGRLELTLADGQIARVQNVEGHVEAELEGRRLEALGRIGWNEIGLLRFAIDPLILDGPPTDRGAWLRATGRADALLRVDLDEIEGLAQTPLLAAERLPFAELGGSATLSARVEREVATRPPDLDVSLSAEDLVVVGPLGPQTQFLARLNREPTTAAPVRIDLAHGWVQLVLDGVRDEVDLELRLADAKGPLLWLDADARVPYAMLWRRARFAEIEGVLRDLKVDVWAHTDWRRLSDLPLPRLAFLSDMDASARAKAHFSGSFDDPNVGVTVEIEDLVAPSIAKPMDAQLVASWKSGTATAEAQIATNGLRILDARAKLEASLPALMEGSENWRANFEAEMCGVPLALSDFFAERGVGGLLTGRIALEQLGTSDVTLAARLQADDLTLGRIRYDDAFVSLSAEDGEAELDARIQGTEGRATVQARLPIQWSEAVPRLDARGQARVALRAQALRLSAFEPFLQDVLVELDGRLDADATLLLDEEPTLQGTAQIRDGRFQIASVGETFFDARADLRLEENGLVRLQGFQARSLEGRIEGDGEAKLDGLALSRARAGLRIIDEVPVVIEGQNFGTAAGEIALEARRQGNAYVVDLDVPKLAVELERSLPDGVQQLEPSERIRIGTVRHGRFVAIPLSPPEEVDPPGAATPILVRVELGDVEIRQGEQVRIRLGGGPRVEIADRMRVEGTIVIEGGTLDVQGKSFDIERSVVTFTGRPPDDPDILATAVWTAPDGTKVFADYTGPLKTGKIELRSDPPLSKNEIVSLLLFGVPSGAVTAAGGGAATGQAVGLGGSLITEGLNEAISDLTSLDLRTRITTDRPGGAATEIELQISRRISLAIAHVLGLEDFAQIPDRNFAIIDWRFAANWSLEASVGDQGSTRFDVLWQHRY